MSSWKGQLRGSGTSSRWPTTRSSCNFELADHAIEQVLLEDSGYTCEFEDIDTDSLLTTQVLILLFERDMSGASIALSELDPTHQLVPLDSTSWIVDSVSYDSFQRAVIAKLNSMGGI